MDREEHRAQSWESSLQPDVLQNPLVGALDCAKSSLGAMSSKLQSHLLAIMAECPGCAGLNPFNGAYLKDEHDGYSRVRLGL